MAAVFLWELAMSSLKYFLNEKAVSVALPVKPPRELDAGFDLPALNDTIIEPGTMTAIETGIHLSIPEGFVGLVRDRSSIALRGGVTVAGVIDAAYRGEVKVLMHNLGKEPLAFKRGERIAQCLVVPHLSGNQCEEVKTLEELGSTERGAGGFGSTGK